MNNNGMKIFMLAVLVIAGFSGTCAAAPSLSNAGGGSWQFYRDITITEKSGSALIDYQILVQLSGSYLPVTRSDGNDIRFTDTNDKELPYWIEDYTGGSARIWVKVPNIPENGEAKIKMYYGNPGAGAASNGDNVFNFFDDFLGSTLDNMKWINNGHTISVFNGVLDITGPALSEARLVSISTYKDGIFEAKIKQISGTDWSELVRSTSNTGGQTYLLRMSGLDGVNSAYFFNCTNGWMLISPQSYNLPDWIVFHIQSFYFSGSSLMGSIDRGIKTNTVADTTYASGPVGFRVVQNHRINVDWALVRKYASPEPTITLGTEQIIPNPTPTLTSTPTPTLTPTQTPQSQLEVKLTSEPASIQPGQISSIKITVTKDGAPVSGVTLMLSSTPEVNFSSSSGTTTLNGEFISTFTAITEGDIKISAMAKKEDNKDGKGEAVVRVGKITPQNTSKQATIAGKVMDAGTDDSLQDVIITVDGKSANTGSNGEYELLVDVGKHNLSASKSGYETMTRSIIVPEGFRPVIKTHNCMG